MVHAPISKHGDSSSGVQRSANMTRRLENLARWRIDSSMIKFPKGGHNFEGGSAVVSRALLASSSDDTKGQLEKSKTGNLTSSNRTPGVLKSARKEVRFSPYSNRVGQPIQSIRNHLRTQSSISSRPSTSETPDEGGNPDNQTAGDEQDHESDGETSERRKVVAVKKMKVKTRVDVVRVLGLTIREAEFLIGLSHENIIKLEGFVEDLSKNIIWLVFPWEENGTLKDFIASAKWETPERISLLHDVAKGVEYLHSRVPPICHGDLKSVNILVNSECRAVITDFGSARHPTKGPTDREGGGAKNDPQPAASPEATFCPSTNTITLTRNEYTLRWAAPELLGKDDASLASDVWALGCVAYEIMTNSIPFQDVKDVIVVMRVVGGDLPSISSDARMALIQALCTLVKQCWSIDASRRPTAEYCRGEIAWMPMIIPNPVRTAGTPKLTDYSAKLLMQLGHLHVRQCDYPNASKSFAEALNLYANLADRNEQANALLELAQVHRLRNEYSEAVTLYSECLQIKIDIGDRNGRASALWGLAEVHRVGNGYSQAIRFYSECLQIWTDIGDRHGRASALLGLAHVHRLRNEYRQAVTFYSECLQIRADIGDRHGEADALLGLAHVHRVRNEYGQAVTFYSECLQIWTDIGSRHGRASALWGLAEVHRVKTEYSHAVTFYSECLQIQTDIGNQRGRASALLGLAHVHRGRHEYSQAVTFYSECLQTRTNIGDQNGIANALWGLAEVHRLRKEYSQALKLFSEALEIYIGIGDICLKAFSLLGIADTHRDQDCHGVAIHPYEQAAEAFQQIGHIHGEAFARERAADARRLLKQNEVAQHFTEDNRD